MNRRMYVIGDIEMGKGDLMDDFRDDQDLVRFIEHTGRTGGVDEVTLVLNGDVFDFLKMDYFGTYPRYITEEISIWKIDKILQTHAKVFEALRKFLQLKHARLVLVIGNHDADVAWTSVQERLLDALSNSSKVLITHVFEGKDFNIQHGNLIDPLFVFPHERAHIEFKGKKILNLPIGAQIASQYLIALKTKFPHVEKMYPQKEAFKKHPEYKREIVSLMLLKGPKIFLADPVLHLFDPMFRVPYYRIAEHLVNQGFDGIHDDRFLNLRLLNRKFTQKPLYILSHAHKVKEVQKWDKRYLVADCWREEFNVTGDDLEKKPKTYVEIDLDGDKLRSATMKVFV